MDTFTAAQQERNLNWLSYTLGRIAVKGGYAYDRYFNAIGSTRGGTFDREIHGPYLKLAFGFGR